MGPATSLQRSVLWGCPGEVIYVGATFVRTSRARAPRTPPFWGVNVYSAPREVASLVVTRQRREKLASYTPTSPATSGLISEFPRELGMPEAQFTGIRFIGGSVNRGPTLLRGAGAATTRYVYRTWALCFACVVLEPCR
jgi:hypothetical protein